MEEINLWTVLAPPMPRDIDVISPFGRELMNVIEREYTAKEKHFRSLKAPDTYRCFVDCYLEDDRLECDMAEYLRSKFNDPQQVIVDENGSNLSTFKSTRIIERSHQYNNQNIYSQNNIRKKCNAFSDNIPCTTNSLDNSNGIFTYSTDIDPPTLINCKNINSMKTVPETQLFFGGSEGLLDEDLDFAPVFENIFSTDNLRLLNRPYGNQISHPHNFNEENGKNETEDSLLKTGENNVGHCDQPLVKITGEGIERARFQTVLNFPPSPPLSNLDNDWCISENFIESLGFTKNTKNYFPENNYLLNSFPYSQGAIKPEDSTPKNPEKQKGKIKNAKVFYIAPDGNRQIEKGMPKVGEESEISVMGFNKDSKYKTTDVSNSIIQSDNYDCNRFKMSDLTNNSSNYKVSDRNDKSAKCKTFKTKNNSGHEKLNKGQKGTISRMEISNKPCIVPKTHQLKITDILKSKRKISNKVTSNEKENQEVIKQSKPFKSKYSLIDFLKPKKPQERGAVKIDVVENKIQRGEILKDGNKDISEKLDTIQQSSNYEKSSYDTRPFLDANTQMSNIISSLNQFKLNRQIEPINKNPSSNLIKDHSEYKMVKLLNQSEINFKIGSVSTNDDRIINNVDAKRNWETLSNASANKKTKFCIPNKSHFTNFDGNNERTTSQTELF